MLLKPDVLRAVCMGFACFWAAFFALNAQAVNFQAGGYTPYSGDYNQDGLLDVLLEPQTKFALVPVGELSVPITITQPYVILLQQSDGSYQLLIHQDKAAFNQIARQPAAYSTLLSDLNGDGRQDLLLQPQQEQQALLTLYSRAEKLAAGLHTLDTAALDLSFNSAVTSVETTDLNGDGRQDLLLIQDNAIQAALYGQAGETLQVANYQPDNPFTALVGNFAGQLDVSPLGAATYTIPIEVPPGLNGL